MASVSFLVMLLSNWFTGSFSSIITVCKFLVQYTRQSFISWSICKKSEDTRIGKSLRGVSLRFG